MSAETIIVTATTIAVRALIDGIAALLEGAKADERAEIERLLAGLHASAPQPVASSLDAITEAHLARVRDLYELRLHPLDPVEGEDADQ